MDQIVSPRVQRLDWLLTAADTPDAFDQYRASIADLHQVTGVSPEDVAQFRNHVIGLHLGEALMAHCTSVAQTFTRTRVEIERSGYDHIMLILDIQGIVTADYDGRAVNSRPGCVLFMDLSRELHTRLTPLEMINLIVPRARFPARFLGLDLHGLTLDAESGGARLLGQHVRWLMEGAHRLTAAEITAAIDAVMILTEGVLGGVPDMSPAKALAAYRTVRSAAKAYIDAHLAHGPVEPGQIAAHLAVTRSTLYRAFETYGGVSAYVLTRRLDRAFEALLKRNGRHPSISQIAEQHGFSSDARFSRAFRDRYGMSPREVEDMPGGPDGAALGRQNQPAALGWMHTL